MIRHIVNLVIPNAEAGRFYDFMINPSDERYRLWWPEEHLKFHIVKHGDKSHLGDAVYFDENMGEKHRLSFHARVVKADRPGVIVWQMTKFGIRLPAFVELQLKDSSEGLLLKHELRLGYGGVGKLLDRVIRIYFNNSFQSALEAHCDIEWYKLRDLLSRES